MILVLDASVVVDLLLARQPYCAEIESLVRGADVLTAPHLLDVEVGQALRRFVLRGDLQPLRAEQAVDDLVDLPLRRYPPQPLLKRAFGFAHNLTMYDAIYVVLAEALEATLITRDNAMWDFPGACVEVRVIGN
jgi:predicted nucleic acid-binding protein